MVSDKENKEGYAHKGSFYYCTIILIVVVLYLDSENLVKRKGLFIEH